MPNTISADASPEKRLFVSLLTRDIPLSAAFLDLIDNSINAAAAPDSARLRTAAGYLEVFNDNEVSRSVDVRLLVTGDKVEIRDNATGISAATAESHVFRFGRPYAPHETDRLSVYGIGLKRAIFKLGKKVSITSDHMDGGFSLDLDVDEWQQDTSQPWSFEITSRPPVEAAETGTQIIVTDLHPETTKRIEDGVFVSNLRELIARTYSFYLAKYVCITLNEEEIEADAIEIGTNNASDEFEHNGLTCSIAAGIGAPRDGRFRDRAAGWYIFCNGRTVISANKGLLTGWGGGGNGLPIFQPKHRPFVGMVFFVAPDPEQLPWSTTKSTINEDSVAWQIAKRRMVATGRAVISFLDGRYTDEGTDMSSGEITLAAGARVSVLEAAASQTRKFQKPAKEPAKSIRIQYDAKKVDVEKIAEYLGRRSMGGAEVGRYTFKYFLKNEVGDD